MTATRRTVDFGVHSPTLRMYLGSILGSLPGEWMPIAEIDPSKKPGEKGRIVHHWRRSVAQLEQVVDETDGTRNLYFAHGRFRERQRRNEHVVATRVVYADCDTAESVEAMRRFRPYPSWVVRTSPGRAQAVWIVRDPASPEDMAAVTRRLGRLLGADKGVWEPSRLLRLPWTLNLNHDPAPLTELEATGRPVRLDRLTAALPTENERSEQAAPHTAEEITGHDVWALYRSLPPHLQQLARGRDEKGQDITKGGRSEPFYRLTMELLERDWGPGAVLAMLRFANRELMGGKYDEDSIWKQFSKGQSKHEQRRGAALIAVTASEITPRAVEWLWKGYVPLGKAVLFDGDPEMGKSTISSADLAARVTTGRDMPDGSPNPFDGPRDVVIMTAEDDYDDTLVPRLIAAKADLSRVHFLEGPKDQHDLATNLRLPMDLNRIRRQIADLRSRGHEVGLVVVDPVIAFFDAKVNSWNDQQSRPVMAALRELARDERCVAVGIRHFKKDKSDAKVMNRGGGTVGMIGAVRAGLVVVDHPEDPELKVFGNSKLNVGVKGPLWSYRIVRVEIEGGIETSKIEWAGKVEGYRDIDHLLATPPREEREPRTSAREWLLTNLPMRSEFMQQWAERDGHAWATMRRARKELRQEGLIDLRKVGGRKDPDEHWEWYLVDHNDESE